VNTGFPTGVEFRKYWEVAMTLRALRTFGAVHPGSELLGIGAGAEAGLFWLSNHVRRVFATDLYIVEDTTWGADPADAVRATLRKPATAGAQATS
jgi:hypothetical protein